MSKMSRGCHLTPTSHAIATASKSHERGDSTVDRKAALITLSASASAWLHEMPEVKSLYAEAFQVVDGILQDPNANAHVQAKIKRSMAIISEALDRFPPETLAMSFNGGKDCLVMLYLIYAQFHLHGIVEKLPTVYIRPEDSFSEVDDFVAACSEKYALDTTTYNVPMKEALSEYLVEHNHVEAIFVGIRRADPWAEKLEYIQPTDHGWPKFVRLHPVLEWEYNEIWTFLRSAKIDYCKLYDEGYTSLGGTNSTIKNPELFDAATGKYRPAYELVNQLSERVGRNKK